MTFFFNHLVELQGTRHGLKRLKSLETSHGSLKKTKTRMKAAVAMRSLLNLLHITDRRKESPVEASAVSTIENFITNHTPSERSSLRTLNPNNWLLHDKEYKDNLSKTWAYFVSDSDKEASECVDNTKSQMKSYSFGASEGHFGHGYCEDSPNDPNENLTLVERPLPCRIKMGISMLQGMNTAKLYSPEIPSLDLHRPESPQGQDAALSAICTYHRCGLPAFKDEPDSADVSNEGNRKTTCSFSDSSCFPKASFSATEPGIYDELPGQKTHISFLPLKPTDSSKEANSGVQPMGESCSSKSFMTVSSSYIPLPNPRTGTSDGYFQNTRDASKLTGQVCESNLKSQQFSLPSSLLLPLKVTQYSKSTGSESQPANESVDSINLIKHSTSKIKLQNPNIATAAPNTNTESLKDGSSLISQQFLMSQDLDELLDDTGSVIQSSPLYSNRHALLPGVENNRSSIEKITTAVSSNHTPATGNMSSQQRRCALPCNYPLVAQTLSQPILQCPPLEVPTVSSAIARTAAINTAGHVPGAVSAASQLGSHEEPNVSFPKSARRCLHGNVKHQFADASLESHSLPKRAKTLECGIHKSSMIAASSVNSKTMEGEFKKSSDLDYNFATVSERSGESYSLMNALLTQMTPRNSNKRPSNACFRSSDSCEARQSELPEIDMNGNYVLLGDGSVLSGQTKQYLNPGNVIPAPLSTSSPMHPKRKPSANLEVLQSLQDFVSPVRHNPKHETHRPTPKELNPRETRLKRHGNNRHNRLSIYRHLDTSSDQELGFVRPCSINYILLLKSAELIVNRIPFKKEIKPFINMKGLLEYLQSFFLSEMSKLPNRNVQTISEYRTLKSESCKFFRPEQLTYETCLSELLMSVLVKEPAVVQTCSDFIFEHLRFLAGCPDFYNMPPELFLMLLSNNKSIVLGYHGFPLPYEESLRQVQRAGRKYIQAHKTGSVEMDSKMEKMLSFVIGQTAAQKSNHVDHENVEIKFKHSYHEIKYRHSEQFVTDTISEYHFLPSLSLTAAGSLRADSEGESSERMSYEKYCSNAYILRRIYFSYVIQDEIPIITHIRLQYAVQGRKVTYSIGSSTSKSECVPFHRSRDQDSADPYAACRTQASDSSDKVAALPKSDSMATAAADKSPTVAEATEKMSAVQLARGEHVTGVLIQGESGEYRACFL